MRSAAGWKSRGSWLSRAGGSAWPCSQGSPRCWWGGSGRIHRWPEICSAPPGTSSGPAASSRQRTWRACSPDAMHLRHEALVDASPETVYALAADVERWPSLHRAYRWCRVLARTPDGLVFEMTGRIRGWPARWTAVQERQPAANRLVLQHLKGITRGMRVAWCLSPPRRADRWCRVLARTPDGLVFEMTGRIRGWPARWTAVQERQPAANRLVFQHIKGITTGMRVAWSLSPQRGGTAVIIEHELIMRWP